MVKLFTWITQFLVGAVLLVPAVTLFSMLALLALIAITGVTLSFGMFVLGIVIIAGAYFMLRGIVTHIFRKKAVKTK